MLMTTETSISLPEISKIFQHFFNIVVNMHFLNTKIRRNYWASPVYMPAAFQWANARLNGFAVSNCF